MQGTDGPPDRQDGSAGFPNDPRGQLDATTGEPSEAPQDASTMEPGERGDAALDADVMPIVDAASPMDAAMKDAAVEDAAMEDAAVEDAAHDAAPHDAAQDADEDASVDEMDPDECGEPPPCVCPHEPRATESGPCAPALCPIDACAPDDHCRYLTFAGDGYYFCDDARTWAQARERCASVAGLHLVDVGGAAEDAFILDSVASKTWLGGSDGDSDGDGDASREGRWRWTDGAVFYIEGDGAPGGAYVNWHPTEPNNIGLSSTPSDCLLLWYENERWADASCGDEHGYVCEVEL